MKIAVRILGLGRARLATQIADLKVRYWRDLLGMRDSRFMQTSREIRRSGGVPSRPGSGHGVARTLSRPRSPRREQG